DLGVAMHALDRVLPRVAVAAEDLDGLLRDPHRGLAGEQLALRAFGSVERLALARHPRRPPHEQPGRVDARLHVGELERDALVLDDRPAELLTRLRIIERDLIGGTRDADRLRADRGAGPLERRHRGLRATGLHAFAGTVQAVVELVLA